MSQAVLLGFFYIPVNEWMFSITASVFVRTNGHPVAEGDMGWTAISVGNRLWAWWAWNMRIGFFLHPSVDLSTISFLSMSTCALYFALTHKHNNTVHAKVAHLHAAYRWCALDILSNLQLKKAIINSFWQKQPVPRRTIRSTTLNHIAIFYTPSVYPVVLHDCSKGCKVFVVSWHVACSHAKSWLMYVAVWFCVAWEEKQAPTQLDLVVSSISICGIAIWSAEAAITSSMMDSSWMTVYNVNIQIWQP